MKRGHLSEIVSAIVAVVTAEPGIDGRIIRERLGDRWNDLQITNALARARRQGRINSKFSRAAPGQFSKWIPGDGRRPRAPRNGPKPTVWPRDLQWDSGALEQAWRPNGIKPVEEARKVG